MFKFKKIFSSILAMVLMVTMAPTVKAHAIKIKFDQNTGTFTVSGRGPMNFAISEDYKKYIQFVEIEDGVTSIGNKIFYGCESLQSIAIPSSVTSIGKEAFAGCYNLASIDVDIENKKYSSIDGVLFSKDGSKLIACPVGKTDTYTIPNNVTSIEPLAFMGNSNLTSIDVDEENTAYKSIDGILFSKDGKQLIKFIKYKKDTSYTIPDSVTYIAPWAFCECINLKSVSIPDGVTSIGEGAFNSCKNLTSVSIPNGVTSIEHWTFCACTNLKSVSIPASVTSIEDSAFSLCEGLTSVIIPDGVTSIGKEAFCACKNLTSVSIPDSVTSIGERAFFRIGLTSITIPDSVTSIGKEAFLSCSSLISITIPASVTYIGNEAFSMCTNLTSVTYLGTTPPEHNGDVFDTNSYKSFKVNVPDDYVGDYFCEKRVKRESDSGCCRIV